ncbi:MAG: lipopolysaccharide biosynthesis protein, partial [Gammaproteobacteria bacterium]
RQQRFRNDVVWTLAGQIASAFALLAGTRVLTELVTPDIYGQVALLNGFVALGVSLFAYPFICAGMRILPECMTRLHRAEVFQAVGFYTYRASILAVALLLLAGMVFSHSSRIGFGPIVLTGMLLIVTVRRELGFQLLIGERKQRGASLWQTSDSVLRPLLAISFVWWGGGQVEWILLGYILASAISNRLCSSLEDIRPLPAEIPIGRDFKADIRAYALPLIPMELIYWINGLGDRYVIGFILTAADVGIYAAAYLIINEAFNRGAMLLLRIFQPVYFQACSNQRTRESFRILWTWIACVLALGIAGVAAVMLLKEYLAAWILAESYRSAAELMLPIAAGCALHALGTAFAQPLLANKKTRLLLVGRLSGVIAASLSIPLMVIHFGLPGAALANPIYFGVEAVVLVLLAKPWRNIETQRDKAIDPVEEPNLNPEVTT